MRFLVSSYMRPLHMHPPPPIPAALTLKVVTTIGRRVTTTVTVAGAAPLGLQSKSAPLAHSREPFATAQLLEQLALRPSDVATPDMVATSIEMAMGSAANDPTIYGKHHRGRNDLHLHARKRLGWRWACMVR